MVRLDFLLLVLVLFGVLFYSIYKVYILTRSLPKLHGCEECLKDLVKDVLASHTKLKELFFEYIKFSLCGVDPETSKAVDDLLSKFSRSNFNKLLGAMDLSDAMFLQSMERILFTSSSFQLPEKPSIKWKNELIENSRKIYGAIKVLEEAIERRNKEKNKE